jgi:hypothetical protein
VLAQIRRVCIAVAIISSVLALISGSIMFLYDPPLLSPVFLATALIAISCFLISGIAAYLES